MAVRVSANILLNEGIIVLYCLSVCGIVCMVFLLCTVVWSPFPDFTDSAEFVKTDLQDMRHVIEDLEEVSRHCD